MNMALKSLLQFACSAKSRAGFLPSGLLLYGFFFVAPIQAQVNITKTSPLPGGTISNSYSTTFTASGCGNNCAWTLLTGSGAVPNGLTLNNDGVLHGTPTAAGTFNFTVRATRAMYSDQMAFSLTIASALSVTTASLAAATEDAAYSQTLAQTGGTSPYSWSISGGSLPKGMTLAPGAGVISGTPSAAGTFNFNVRVTDSAETNGAVATKALSIAVAPALVITTSSLPGGVTGSAYSQTVARTGGTTPVAWSLAAGALPAGLTLNSGTGTISGNASAAGTFSFTVRATDVAGAVATKALSIVIAQALSITTSSAPGGSTGISYSTSLVATGGTTPYSWTITTGSLPNGLILNASSGTISGTPTTVGTFNFTVRVSDAIGATASKALSITVATPLSITTTAMPGGSVGVTYSQNVSATGGTPPYSWSISAGSIPTGLSLNANSGLISGMPSVAGIFNFTVRVSGSVAGESASKALSINIDSGSGTPTLTITNSSTLPSGTPSVGYLQSLTATGGVLPYSWSVTTGTLPTGLLLNSGGVLSGTPTASGTFNFTVQVRDSASTPQTATRTLSLTIIPALTITTSSLPDATAGLPYSATLAAAAGTPPYSWSLTMGSLPTGINLNTSTGTISGTTTATGTYNIRITLTDSLSVATSKAFTLVVSLTQIDANISSTLNPADQLPLSLTARSSFPSPISGQLILSFTPNAAIANVLNDDPMPQFSNGSRTVSFSIPANSTTVVLSPSVKLLTGTVAGTIRLTASIQGGPSNMQAGVTEIPALPPQITALEAVQTSAGISIRTTGYSDLRSVTSVGFGFDLKSASGTQRINLTRNVDSDFTAWYKNPASAAFGGAFIFVQSFAVEGDASFIEAVTVTLVNSQGSTVSNRTLLTRP